MKRMRSIILLVVLTLVLLSGCQAKPTPEPTPAEVIATSTPESLDTPGVSFKTLVAGTLTAIAGTMRATDYSTATETSTATIPPAPTEPLASTPTQEVVRFTTTGDIYCRKGPAANYPSVTILASGTTGEVLGKDAYDSFLYLQTSEYTCWVSAMYGTVNGNLEILPVFTPQPTALPTRTPTLALTGNFSASYKGLTACPGGYAFNFQIKNTGRLRLESVRIISRVKGQDGKFVHESDTFTQWSGGAKYLSSLELLVGETAIVSTCQPGGLTFDPSGINVDSNVTVCSSNGLAGSCTYQDLSFTP